MISLKMSFYCIIGCLKQERKKKQKVKIKLKLDSLEFIDYSNIANFIYTKMKKKKFVYIEDALCYFEKKLKKTFPSIISINMQIYKPEIFKLCKSEYKAIAKVGFHKIY